jgi:carbamoyltransferase
MDGLDAIYRAHGREHTGRDDFYDSGVRNALRFFNDQGIRATFFVIASDLENPAKRDAIESVVAAGHHIGCHTLNHRYLEGIGRAEKTVEIVDAKARIEDALGVSCQGFRAPGYSVDYESLELIRDAGYLYDSSVFPSQAFRERLGLQRLFPEPFMLWPENGVFEVPMPYLGPFIPAFHPCYAFYLRLPYFKLALRRFAKNHGYFTLLFHLTDFANRQRRSAGPRLALYTNNLFSWTAKERFLGRIIGQVRRSFDITTTEEFLDAWPESAPDLDPSVILGISTTHETGACVVRSGEVLAALSEERLSRKKLDSTYPPKRSIREAIQTSGVQPHEIEAVAVGGLHWKDLLSRSLDSLKRDVRDYHSFNDYFPHFCRILYRLFYFWRASGYSQVRKFLAKEYGISPKVFYVEHHEAHAASVYRTSRWSGGLIVTADGVGDDLAFTISEASGSMIRRLCTLFYPNSFGQFYTACTQLLGFRGGRHEGKITGLSGYGEPNEEVLERVEKTLFTGDDFKLHKRYYAEGFVRPSLKNFGVLRDGRQRMEDIEYRNYKMPLKRLLAGYSREDVAYAFQHLLEREVVQLMERFGAADADNIGLAGGVFANVKLNMAVSESFEPQSIYIFPAMGDGGLAVGAALSVSAELPREIPDVYLGTGYSDDEIGEICGEHGDLAWHRPERLADSIARELADGKIVARFAGRMEFGPRALGNRSILYHCDDPSVNDWLNKQLGRTEFMPFAPICIFEDAAEYFEIRPGELRPCEFMTIVVHCTERMKRECPAAVHVDGTARPQLVRRTTNPDMYDILVAYRELTGISCVINTSFNMHEEPIVRTPEEALRAFRQSHLHSLNLGPWLVRPGEAGADLNEARVQKAG